MLLGKASFPWNERKFFLLLELKVGVLNHFSLSGGRVFAAQTLTNPSVYQTTPFSVCIVNLFVADFPFSEILKLMQCRNTYAEIFKLMQCYK